MKARKSSRMQSALTYALVTCFIFRFISGYEAAGQVVVVDGQRPASSEAQAPEKLRGASQRPFTLDDLDRIEYLGEYNSPFTFSPDGKELAFVRVRPVTSTRLWPQNYLFGGERSDIWLIATEEGRPINITQGERDGSGYFMPSWSPDGARLAMLSTKGGNLRLWVWERATGQLRMLSERAASLRSWDAPFIWVSNEKLACSLMPEGAVPSLMNLDLISPKSAMKEWPKAWNGQEPTASGVESGVPAKPGSLGQDQLTLIDVVNRQSKVIATGTFRSIKLSPSEQQIAFLKRTSLFQDPPRSLTSRPWSVLRTWATN